MKKKVLIGVCSFVALVLMTFSQESRGEAAAEMMFCSQSSNIIQNNLGTFTFGSQQSNIHFSTDFVCGATQYTWTIGDASITTLGPTLTLSASDFLWMPAGGCVEFNQNITPYSPPGLYGTYHTSLKVKANAGIQNTLVQPVNIEGVHGCTDGRGGGLDWLGGLGGF